MVGILSPYLMGPAQGLLAPSAPAAAMAAPVAQQTASTGGGLLARIAPQMAQSRGYQMFDQRRNMIANALLGGVGAETPLERMRGMAQGAIQGREKDSAYEVEARKQQENQRAVSETLKLLTEKRPDLVPWVQSGAISPADAFNAVYKADSKATDDISEYQFAVQQGFQGTFTDYMTEMKKAGAQTNNITVGGGRYGTIPQGYELIEGPEGASMRPIPGGPEDTSKKDAKAAGQADVATRVVTSAAQRAREAARNRQFGGVGQSVVQNMPWTDSAEVARQVEVLKSTAKVENLTAMRAASPTGGALGSVTEKEADMLAAKSGALDPSSPTFERDLDDYELTLLQVVHGPEAGKRIFDETRRGNAVNDLKTKYGLD